MDSQIKELHLILVTSWNIFLVHPVIRVSQQFLRANIGDDITMGCYVEASPQSVTFWTTKDGK